MGVTSGEKDGAAAVYVLQDSKGYGGPWAHKRLCSQRLDLPDILKPSFLVLHTMSFFLPEDYSRLGINYQILLCLKSKNLQEPAVGLST